MYIAMNFENIGFPGDNGTNFDIISLGVVEWVVGWVVEMVHNNATLWPYLASKDFQDFS